VDVNRDIKNTKSPRQIFIQEESRQPLLTVEVLPYNLNQNLITPVKGVK